MESWRLVWRRGFLPQFRRDSLESLATALREDDPRILQRATTSPPPLQCVHDWPIEATCPVGFVGAAEHGGIGTATVAQVSEFFCQACYSADQLLKEPAVCRYFLNWVDDTPRDEMRRELLAEVERALQETEVA